MSGDDPFGFAADPRNQLQALLDSERVGVIDGVNLDLNHPQLPVEVWHAPDSAYGVDLWFPSEGRDFGDEPTPSLVGGEGPGVIARAGDSISIATISRFDRHLGPLADPHDTEEWWATLRLVRADSGERLLLDGVVAFVPRDALSPHSPHLEIGDEDYAAYYERHLITFDKIGRRIDRLASSIRKREPAIWAKISGVKYRITESMLEQLDPDAEIEHGWAYEAPVGRVREWLTLADRAHELALDAANGSDEELRSGGLEVLLDTVAAAAYALARAESEMRVAPLAEKGIRAQRSLQAATRKAQQRGEPVRRRALEEIWRAKGRISQTRCATLVANALGREQRAVERLISTLFEWRDLPGGGREKRPRAEVIGPRRSAD